MLALLVGETGEVNETPKRYTRAKITYLALLMFFSSLVCGVLFYRRGVPLSIAVISAASAFVISMCVLVTVVRLSRQQQ